MRAGVRSTGRGHITTSVGTAARMTSQVFALLPWAYDPIAVARWNVRVSPKRTFTLPCGYDRDSSVSKVWLGPEIALTSPHGGGGQSTPLSAVVDFEGFDALADRIGRRAVGGSEQPLKEIGARACCVARVH